MASILRERKQAFLENMRSRELITLPNDARVLIW